MKKLLLASAVAALSVTAANAAPTVYGKAFLTVDASSSEAKVNGNKVGDSTSSRPALNSNSSRIGFKGSEALTANTDLLYQLEYGIDVDNGNVRVNQTGKVENKKSQQFYARDTYLGLANAQYGTFKAGRLTAIDGEVDFANVTAGGIAGGIGYMNVDDWADVYDAPRINNSMVYASPNYNGMKIFAMYGLDEDGNSREIGGLAGTYEQGPMRVGASYLRYAGGESHARVSGGYDINPAMSVGALYQLSDYKRNSKENTFTVSGEMKTATPWIAYAQGDMVNNIGGAKDIDGFRLAVGGKYAFNKATLGHVYGVMGKNEAPSSSGKQETTAYGVGGGIEYKF